MFEKLSDMIGGALAVVFFIAWSFGGIIGAIYWAVQEDLLNVVLSIFIPFYGFISMVIDLL